MRKGKVKNQRDPLPEHFSSMEEAAEFWDTHDSADYEEHFKDVKREVDLKRRVFEIAVEGDLFEKVSRIARIWRLSPEKLIDSWLREKAS